MPRHARISRRSEAIARCSGYETRWARGTHCESVDARVIAVVTNTRDNVVIFVIVRRNDNKLGLEFFLFYYINNDC